MTAPTEEQTKAMADRAEARARGETAKDSVETTAALDAELKRLAALAVGVYESSRVAEANDSNSRVQCTHTQIQPRNHISARVSAPAEPDAERNSRSSRAVLHRVVVPGRRAAPRRQQSVECKPGRWVVRRTPVQAPHKLGLRIRTQAPPNQQPMRQPLKTLKRLLLERELYS